MSQAEVSLFPSNRAALSGVQLQGQKRRRSQDQRPKRIPKLDSADSSALEYTSPLLLWCTSGQYWPSSEGSVCRASSRWVCLLLAFVTLGHSKAYGTRTTRVKKKWTTTTKTGQTLIIKSDQTTLCIGRGVRTVLVGFCAAHVAPLIPLMRGDLARPRMSTATRDERSSSDHVSIRAQKVGNARAKRIGHIGGICFCKR